MQCRSLSTLLIAVFFLLITNVSVPNSSTPCKSLRGKGCTALFDKKKKCIRHTFLYAAILRGSDKFQLYAIL